MIKVKKVEDLTPQELEEYNNRQEDWEDGAVDRAWQAIRQQRDSLLAATDWAALPDSPAYSQELLAYRQSLRDLPEQYTNPDDVVWPDNPLEG